MTEPIRRNRIRCLKCGDVIESTHRHDMRWCCCGNCAVDGGDSYHKRAWLGGEPTQAFEEMP